MVRWMKTVYLYLKQQLEQLHQQQPPVPPHPPLHQPPPLRLLSKKRKVCVFLLSTRVSSYSATIKVFVVPYMYAHLSYCILIAIMYMNL